MAWSGPTPLIFPSVFIQNGRLFTLATTERFLLHPPQADVPGIWPHYRSCKEKPKELLWNKRNRINQRNLLVLSGFSETSTYSGPLKKNNLNRQWEKRRVIKLFGINSKRIFLHSADIIQGHVDIFDQMCGTFPWKTFRINWKSRQWTVIQCWMVRLLTVDLLHSNAA